MAVYYNDDKNIFIESDLSSDTLRHKGYRDINILKLKVGENKNKTIWVLKGYLKNIGITGIQNSKFCEIIEDKKVESLNEIRAYFAYLKHFILASLPRNKYCYRIDSIKL